MFTHEELLSLESIIVIRILNSLGYWGNNEQFKHIITGDIIEKNMLPDMMMVKHDALREINKALRETQL